MSADLTIALCLRDDEAHLADMAKSALTVARTLAEEHASGDWRDQTREEAWIDPAPPQRGDLGPSPLGFEILALDESSRDNTLSVLSILHGRHPELRTVDLLSYDALADRWKAVPYPYDRVLVHRTGLVPLLFAHAPSKVRATLRSWRELWRARKDG